MKINSQCSDFNTERRFFFSGKETYSTGECVIAIHVEKITTKEMVEKMENLITETAEKAKKIVAEQDAPQQLFRKRADATDEWLAAYRESAQAAHDTHGEF